MNRFFKRLPLPVKLILIGLVPFVVLVYLSYHLYDEKAQKVKLLRSYKQSLLQSADIYSIVDNLQNERKYSIVNILDNDSSKLLSGQRALTDAAIGRLLSGADSSISHFTSYTFLNDLGKTRALVDSNQAAIPYIMHYYTTAIFRINSLNSTFPGTDVSLRPLYKNLVSQKILSEMIMNLGIMSSDIYNALYEKKYLAETLAGMIGVHDVYNSYEKEFILRGDPEAISAYHQILLTPDLKSTLEYIDKVFTGFKNDSTYSAEKWATISDAGTAHLQGLRKQVWANVDISMNEILENEEWKRDWILGLLLASFLLVICTIIYSVSTISGMLFELKTAAQAISEGVTGVPIYPVSRDALGSLTESIIKIDSNNKRLASAAEQIGNGNFNIALEPRSKDDLLGNALLKMKTNLQRISVEKEQNEEELRQMAEKYRTIFYKSPLPKWIFDIYTLGFLEVNDAAVRHYGYSREEFLQMTIKDIRPENDLERFFHHIKETTPTTIANLTYWQHVKKNGEVIQVELTAHMIDYEDRQARMVIVHDITERRKAEEDILVLHQVLSKSEKRFRAMLENNNEIIALLDDNIRTFYRSPASARITGWSNAERDQMESISIVHPDDVAYIEKVYDNVLTHPGLSIPISHRYLHKNGHFIWLEGTMTNMLHDPAISGIITNLKDVTERKLAEEKLLKSEKIYKTIASGIPGSVICLLDTDYCVLMIEGDMGEQLGYSRDTFIGKKAADVFPGDRFSLMYPHFKLALEDEASSIETTRNGYDFITRFVPLKDELGDVYGAMSVSIDITELKNAQRYIHELNVGLEQKVLERTSELQVVNKELEAFSYSVSHDLRAPLRIIDGFANMLITDYGANLGEEAIRILSVIMNNAQRMGKLIDDLLNLSRLGRKELVRSNVEMNKLVSDVIKEQEVFNKRHTAIRKENLLAAPCDPGLITQVWSNLISNALKYSAKVTEPAITISSYNKENDVVYAVNDNGVGFNMEYAGKLFGVFERLHKVKDFEGTGIGLALVQRIIEKHGGKVWAKAAVNQGATFYFSLPLADQQQNKA